MIKKMLGCGGAFWLLALTACGGSVQSVGDGATGAGGSNKAQAQSGSTAQQHGGSSSSSGGTSARGRDGEPWAPGTCDPPCSQGYGCYEVANDPAGFCAPLCETQYPGQTADANVSCTNSVRGGNGTCVYSYGYGWPTHYEDVTPGDALPRVQVIGTGLCSNACDPVLHDCPAGYTCDLTSPYVVDSLLMYACMPNKKPQALGDACTGGGDGECGPGLTCTVVPDNDGIYNASCTAFCYRHDTSACPAGQTCSETGLVDDPNIGVCL